MSKVGQIERETQNRLVKLLQEKLGYEYLGNWEKQNNSNLVEAEYLAFQASNGVSEDLAKKSFRELEKISTNGSVKLYQSNKDFYEKLRYGVKIAPELGDQNLTVWPIDWKNIERNRFSFSQEVTVAGALGNKRPDIVVYINGIAITVIELKRSTVSIEEGILQHLDNQHEDFIESFFTTVQILIAGNDTQGVKYGTVGTERNGYYYWNEEDAEHENKLDSGMKHLLSKERLIRIIYSFIAFSNGTKLICRSNQFHGVNKLLDSAKKDESGIIWHTQGSGKSMTMVWGARAIREEIDNARVLVITDRHQLDEQIEGIFNGVKEPIIRTKSGADLFQIISRLDKAGCSRYVLTDINRDGALNGPNLELLKEVSDFTNTPIVASGGVSSLSDVKALMQLTNQGVEGVIIGKALYTGAFTLDEVLAVSKGG